MKRFLFTSLTVLIALGTVLIGNADAQRNSKFKRAEKGVANQYIVVLNERYLDKQIAEPSVRSSADYLKFVYGGKVKNTFSRALMGFVGEMTERQAIALSKDDRVAYVEQDSFTTAEGVQSSPTWGLDRIDQRNLPLDARYTFPTDASNVHAYVIDSGIRTSHVSFGGRATLDYNGINDGNQDCLGHGTHVSGTLGSSTWGVAKNVRLHGVRVMGCTNSGTVSAIILGIDWVAENRILPAVANISITASSNSNSFNSAVNALYRAGVTVVTSAGNYNSDACNYSPANVSNAITVGAVTGADYKASFSNYGSCVDLWAPGVAIHSASHADDTSSRMMGGTSMASPHVAGVAALYLASNPSASPSEVNAALTSTTTNGGVGGLTAESPNKMVHSWLSGSAPSAQAASVTIRKRANRRTESIVNASFTFDATNLSSSNFTLAPDNTFTDAAVGSFGSANTIVVTEAQAFGWQLSSISCTETTSGGSSIVNSTVDLANRKATIVAEEGEQIDCTFTSDEIVPSAATATVSGAVLSRDGRGIRGITITLLDASTNTAHRTVTNSFGYYSFEKLPVENFYVLTATSSSRYPISDNVQTFTLQDDLKVRSFVVSR